MKRLINKKTLAAGALAAFFLTIGVAVATTPSSRAKAVPVSYAEDQAPAVTPVEAERAGLVSRILPAADLVAEALKTAKGIADKSALSVMAAKEAVNRALETSLAEGLLHERRLFHALFATADQKEGMQAFLEKRAARFQNK